jgi:outer membrane protein
MSFRTSLTRLALPLAMAAAWPAQAQSLADLYEAARTYDAAVLAARAQAESAGFRAAQSDALRLPGVTLSGQVVSAELHTPGGRQTSDAAQATLGARQPLFNRANDATISQAEKTRLAAQTDLDTAEQDLIVRLAQAYFDVLAAQDSVTTTRANKTFITEQLASARRNFEVGTATITDTREAQARFDLATAQEIAAQNELRTRQIALDQLVGRQGVAPLPLKLPVALPPVMPAEVEPWVQQAEAEHPLVRKAQLGLEVATLETAKARAGHLPTVEAVASADLTRRAGSAVPRDGTTKTGSVGVQFNLPLFAGFSVQNRISETLALEERSRNDLEGARRSVAQATRQVFFGVQSGQAQVKALEAAESSTKLALEATQLGYKVGVRVNLDVLNAQSQLFQTQRELARARYDVLLASLRLRQAAGQLAPTDLTAMTPLLAR